MSNRSKMIVFSSVLLAVLVLSGLLINFRLIPAGSPLMFLYAGLALISILSVPIVWWMKIRKKKFEKLLARDYLVHYESVRDIIDQADLPGQIRREILDDLLDLLLTAQQAHRKADQVIGNDRQFAAEMIAAFSQRKRPWWRVLPDSAIFLAAALLGIHTLSWLETMAQDWFATRLDNSMVLLILLIALILLPVLRLNSLQKQAWFYVLPIIFGLCFILLAEILRRYAMGIPIVQIILDGSVNLIANIWILLFLVGLIPAMILLKLLINRRIFTRN